MRSTSAQLPGETIKKSWLGSRSRHWGSWTCCQCCLSGALSIRISPWRTLSSPSRSSVTRVVSLLTGPLHPFCPMDTLLSPPHPVGLQTFKWQVIFKAHFKLFSIKFKLETLAPSQMKGGNLHNFWDRKIFIFVLRMAFLNSLTAFFWEIWGDQTALFYGPLAGLHIWWSLDFRGTAFKIWNPLV